MQYKMHIIPTKINNYDNKVKIKAFFKIVTLEVYHSSEREKD